MTGHPPPDPGQQHLVQKEPAVTAPKTPRQGTRLGAFVARIGDSLVAVRAWDADDARTRVIEQLRLGYLVGVGDEIEVRPATRADAEMLERFEGGSRLFRCEWARDASAQGTATPASPAT